MFPDYEKLVLHDFLQKSSENKLPLNLTMPAPARLREECERVCAERFERRDEVVIRNFFGKSGDKDACLKIIQDCNIDRFRPLVKYLKTGGVTNPEPENIELLAWLIDFHDRPFVLGKRYPAPSGTGSVIKLTLPADDYSVGPVVEQGDPGLIDQGVDFGISTWGATGENEEGEERGKEPIIEQADGVDNILPRWRYWSALVAGFLLLLAGIVGFQTWEKKKPTIMPTSSGGCMYWTGDHYQPIPCTQKMSNTLVIALDSILIKKFRKITQPDTITYNAKGAVWYSKINNNVEFFTADGVHPIVTDRHLKPITNYMIDKYIRSGISANQ